MNLTAASMNLSALVKTNTRIRKQQFLHEFSKAKLDLANLEIVQESSL